MPTPPPPTTWDEALAQYQHHLDSLAVLIASGDALTFPEWEPPTNLGPIPVALTGLATSLAERNHELTQALAHAMIKTRQDLEALNRPTNQPMPVAARPTMLDEKA